jgi:hypothetical protein
MGTGALPDRIRLRSTGQYAKVNGVWYESAHSFPDGRYPTDISIALYSSATGMKFQIEGSQVEAMEHVAAKARYRGVWFMVGSFWSKPDGFQGPDYQDGRIRGSVASNASGCYAWLVYRGPEGRAIAQLPGARPSEAWPQNYDEVTITVPVDELENYSEEVTAMTPREN